MGAESPRTALYIANLAALYRRTGHPDKALPLLRRSFEIQTASLGPMHGETLITRHNIAYALDSTGRRSEATSLLREAYEEAQAELGVQDRSVLMLMRSLAFFLKNEGELGEALRVAVEASKRHDAAYGPSHRLSLYTFKLIPQIYSLLEQHELALAQLPVLEQRLKEAKLTELDQVRVHVIMAHLEADAGRFEQAQRRMKAIEPESERSHAAIERTLAYIEERRRPAKSAE